MSYQRSQTFPGQNKGKGKALSSFQPDKKGQKKLKNEDDESRPTIQIHHTDFVIYSGNEKFRTHQPKFLTELQTLILDNIWNAKHKVALSYYLDFLAKMFCENTKNFSQDCEAYIVFKGRNPGIYLTYIEVYRQISNFPGARYSKVQTLKEAIEIAKNYFGITNFHGKISSLNNTTEDLSNEYWTQMCLKLYENCFYLKQDLMVKEKFLTQQRALCYREKREKDGYNMAEAVLGKKLKGLSIGSSANDDTLSNIEKFECFKVRVKLLTKQTLMILPREIRKLIEKKAHQSFFSDFFRLQEFFKELWTGHKTYPGMDIEPQFFHKHMCDCEETCSGRCINSLLFVIFKVIIRTERFYPFELNNELFTYARLMGLGLVSHIYFHDPDETDKVGRKLATGICHMFIHNGLGTVKASFSSTPPEMRQFSWLQAKHKIVLSHEEYERLPITERIIPEGRINPYQKIYCYWRSYMIANKGELTFHNQQGEIQFWPKIGINFWTSDENQQIFTKGNFIPPQDDFRFLTQYSRICSEIYNDNMYAEEPEHIDPGSEDDNDLSAIFGDEGIYNLFNNDNV